MNPNPGQKPRVNRPALFMSTLMPMGPGVSMQPVVMSAGGMGPIFTSTTMGQQITQSTGSVQVLPTEHVPHSQPVAMMMQPLRPQRAVPKADLYLCKTSNNASEPPSEGEAGNGKRVSLNDLERSFKDLDSQQINDSLSSFLPNVPGEFDRMPDTMLRQLLEQRTIGGKDFSPLSGQALLGFRLLPGPLPEMYRMDPPLVESKSRHKKRKHKHKNIEKGDETGGEASGPLTSKIKLPSDAYSFIKQQEPSATPHISLAPSHTPSHTHIISGGEVGGVIRHQPAREILARSNFQPVVQIPNLQVAGAAAPLMGGVVIDSQMQSTFPVKKPKKPKKKKEKESGEKKVKKKKKKHHNQDLPGPGSGPGPSTIISHQTPYGQFPNP